MGSAVLGPVRACRFGLTLRLASRATHRPSCLLRAVALRSLRRRSGRPPHPSARRATGGQARDFPRGWPAPGGRVCSLRTPLCATPARAGVFHASLRLALSPSPVQASRTPDAGPAHPWTLSVVSLDYQNGYPERWFTGHNPAARISTRTKWRCSIASAPWPSTSRSCPAPARLAASGDGASASASSKRWPPSPLPSRSAIGSLPRLRLGRQPASRPPAGSRSSAAMVYPADLFSKRPQRLLCGRFRWLPITASAHSTTS